MPFDNVVGHERARDILASALQRRRFPPSLLLVGPEGVGKRTLALAVARALMCDVPGSLGCGACTACHRIDRGTSSLPALEERARESKSDTAMNLRLHPDLILVQPWTTTREGKTKAAAEIKVEQIRDLVQETFKSPFEAHARCFVIDAAHLMNESSANSLLKSLEEPPATTHFILVSSAPQALLQTIRSRCQTLALGPLPSATLEAHLIARGLAKDEARLRVALSGGSLGQALAFESDSYRGLREEALVALENAGTELGRLEAAERLSEQGDVPLALVALRSLLRDVAALRAGQAGERLLNLDVADRLTPLAKGPLGDNAGALAERVDEAILAIKGNATKLLTIDALLAP